ncbi:L,D-transpeptidase family protein [Zoogloea sp.]|uniref:L,D-transpeptidase family protein n=1 Tax=Zoogloea sp. TaxID=49181 RepID=UPI00261F973E|nr:L,D-transpeptidase family protein [Zoogloea sp.]MDD3353749.1 L,D-transpeptidase family protein [Zoogloea sp.]
MPALRWRASLALALLLGVATPLLAQEAVWFAGERPAPVARQAVEILRAAPADGLDPADYGADALTQAVGRAADGAVLDPAARTRLATDLESAVRRYLTDLHFGRVDPRRIHTGFDQRPPAAFDAASALQEAVARGRLEEAVVQARPALPLYAGLRRALAHYRELADPWVSREWQTPLPPIPSRKLEPGGSWSGLPALARRLVVLGDLSPDAKVPPLYQGGLLEAVKAFQVRHGLNPDGVIGRGTLQQLEVSPRARIRQIELNLERLRWTPLVKGRRMIVVNVPEFALWAYEVREGRLDLQLRMKVIVGKALDTRTPLFSEDMRFIEFSPYWNVPPSIARGEVVPKLQQDPAYLARQGFEFVPTSGGAAHTAVTPEALEAVLRGQLRIRQRPGPRNALGDIKFVFPNHEAIYLHHTPSVGLFQRDRRDFSHGCIRVEDPVTLARYVLRDQPEWDEARIRGTMGAGTSRTIRLKTPIPVVIAYATAMATSEGKVRFFTDIYGHDGILDAALRQRRRSLPAAL